MATQSNGVDSNLSRYNHSVKAILLNRISMLLAFAGIFVAGVLSLAHLMRREVPCGLEKGCEDVLNSSAAFWLGYPVAFYGLAGYVLLTFLAGMRAMNGMKSSKGLVLAGVIVSGFGVAASGYLTYTALTKIKAVCPWCLTSAAIMVALFVVHLLMLKAPEPEEGTADFDFKLMLGSGLATMVVLFGSVVVFPPRPLLAPPVPPEKLPTIPISDLVPPDAHIDGAPEAPVTIVEFADMTCPMCKAVFPQVRQIVQESKGKIRLVYRHLPLSEVKEHELALPAAFVAELAAEKGKFWEFVTAIFSLEGAPTIDQILRLGQAIGYKKEQLDARMADPKDPAWAKVSRDKNLAQEIFPKLQTPIFIVFAEGVKDRAQASNIDQLRQILSIGAIADRLNK